MLVVKNKSDYQKIWCGQTIEPNATYQIQASEKNTFAYDNDFLLAVAIGDAVLFVDDLEIVGLIETETYLREEIKRDTEGNPIYRNILAAKDMLFQPRCIDFTTGKIDSICNKSSDMTDLGDAELHFFNGSYVELTQGESETDQQFQTRLDENCVFTWLYLTFTHRYAIKSGEIRYKGTLGEETDLWIEVAPHIPKAYGGSVPFINGGLPLDFFNEKESIVIDGGTCALIELDNTYLSHRLGVKVEHGIGIKFEILATFNVYK